MANDGHLVTTPHVLIFQQDDSIGQMSGEICGLEGIESKTVTTAQQAFDVLDSPDSGRHENGRTGRRWIVLLDNLQVSYEGQAFLRSLRNRPRVRAGLKTVCVAAEVNCQWARREYEDVLDAYLALPFRVEAFLEVIGIGLQG